MKKLFSSALLLISLLSASLVMAATYGSADTKFTLTPAAGWTEKAIDSGVQLTNGKSVLAIVVAAHGGMTLEAFGDAVVQQSGMTASNKEMDGDTLSINGQKDGTNIQVILTKLEDGKNILSFTLAGPDTDDMKKMIGSLKDVE